MFPGTRNQQRTGQRIGTSVLALAFAAGIAGSALAQDASPEASPAASPAASVVTSGFPAAPLLSESEIEGDSTTLAVAWDGETLEVLPAETELRPTVILQTTNGGDTPLEFALLQTPEGFDPATFSLADFGGTLPDGVTAVGAYSLDAEGVEGAVFEGLTAGSYMVAASNGQSFGLVLTEPAPLDVPDIFASPDASPAATPAT